ncbi:MAG: outer membrane protein assembly factor BamA [Planctomycetia bacterium]|nr:outer membrane protein assembly factor BamA [Planctomycetia bacterium]
MQMHRFRMERSPLGRLGIAGLVLLLTAGGAGLAVLHAQAPAAPAVARATVNDIRIRGNRNTPSENIKNQMRTRVGKDFSAETLQEDVRTLYNSRSFARVWADKEDDGKGGVVVIINVREFPSLVRSVEYRGNTHLSKDELDNVTNVRKGMPCNPYANKVACQRIVQRYNEDGRPYAACNLIKGDDENDTEVIFNITEGPKVYISSIDFTGNTFVTGAVLKQRINSSSMLLGDYGLRLMGQYNPGLLEHDVNELIRYYRGFGFHDVRISRQVIYAPDSRSVRVVFHIQEGIRYKVDGTPQVTGSKSIAAEALEAMNKQKSGEYYDQRTIDGDISRISDYYGYTGRQTRVMPEASFMKEKPGFVRVNYQVEEQKPAVAGQVIIVGNERTDQRVILRQIPIYPGQTLTYPDLRLAERNLARLNIFESSPDGSVRPTVTVRDNPFNPDSNVKDIVVNVQEASTGSLMFGLGVNSDSGFTGSVVLNERNFDLFRPATSLEDLFSGGAWRGAGQELRIEAVPGTQLQRYMVTFREPFLFDSPYSMTLSGYYYQRYFNEYHEDRLGARATIGRKLNDRWSASVTTRAESVGVSNVSFFAPEVYRSVSGDNFLVGVRAGVTRDSRDSVLRPTDGSLLDVSYEQCFGDRVFPLVNFEYSQYWTMLQRADGSGRQVLAFHTQTGWAGSNTPVFERYFGGGFRSIRGFQFRGVGPQENGFKTGGTFMLLNSLEYQVPLRASDQVFLVGFVDSGTVATRIQDFNDYRVSVGFGLRFTVPMLGPVPIALDFGFPVVSGQYDNKQVFNFWMGFTR